MNQNLAENVVEKQDNKIKIEDKNVKIIIATHKKYQMPKENDLYLPLHVGAEGKEGIGYQKDNIGDSISLKNPYFCELTGLYWAWKNLDADYIGLVHYRRYLTAVKKIPKTENERFKAVLNKEQVSELLKDTDIILPQKRNYYIETIYSHYKHTMYIEPLDIAGEILKEKYPEYYPEFEKLKTKRSAHLFNMFIMKKEYLDQYCTWLFDILSELEKRVDNSQYDSFHARFYGRISERFLDIWINTNKLNYKEVKLMDMQDVNWFKKGSSFLIAKFTGKKYGKSF